MYEKLKKINSTIWKDYNSIKLIFIIGIILCIISISLVTVKNEWSTLLVYPEETYQCIENEALKMADTHNLETDYECIYTYSNTTNTLSLNLRDVNRSSVAITAEVSDYHTDRQDISITRNNNKVKFVLVNIFADFIGLPLMLSIVIGLAIMIILALALLIAFIFHSIRKKLFKEK